MLRLMLASCIALCPAAALVAAEKVQTRGLTIVIEEEVQLRNALLRDIQSPQRTTAIIASAELQGGYADDPEVVTGLLDILDRRYLGSDPADPLSSRSFRAVLEVLGGMDASAWTPETQQRADRIVAAIDHRFRVELSEDDLDAIDTVYGTLEDLAGVSLAYGEIQGLIEGKTQFTDVDVFVCSEWSEDEELVFHTLDFAHALAAADFGRVRLRRSTPELEKELAPDVPGTSVFIDVGHPEEKEFGVLEAIFADYELPDLVLRGNKGEPSLWYLSAFVCP